MAHFLRYLTAALVLGIASTSIAAARTGPEPVRQVTFTVFSAQPVAGLAYEPTPGVAPLAVIFYPTARSPRYVYRGPARLRFSNVASGEVIADVPLPSGGRALLLIFTANENPGPGVLPYRVQVVDDDVSVHATGTLKILNLSGLKLTGVINGRQVELIAVFNEPIRVGGTAVIELRTPFRSRNYQAYAETIALDHGGRALLLLLPPSRRGSLEVQSRVLVDDPAPPRTRPAPGQLPAD